MRIVRRLLVFRFGQIGDTVVALPSLWLLRRHFPGAQISLLSEFPRQENQIPPEQVLPPTGLVDVFMKYQGGSSAMQLLSYARFGLYLRRNNFDALAYLAPTSRTPRQRKRDRLFFRMAGIRRALGFEGFPDDPFPRSPDGSLLPVMHEADALLRRLAASGLPAVEAGGGCMDLLLTPEDLSRAEAWWRRQETPVPALRRWFAVCPGSKWSSKLWPLERFLEVGRRLKEEQGLLPVVVGGPEDREAARRLIAAWGGGLCAAGDLSVRDSAALLGGAAFYLGNDTGAMHLAAAVGTPCVAVFSAIDWPGRWSPYGRGHHVFRAEVPCSGCRLEVCNQQLQCLTGIGVGSVHQACLEVLSRNPPS